MVQPRSMIGTQKTTATDDTANLHLRIKATLGEERKSQKALKEVLDRLQGTDGFQGYVMTGNRLRVTYKPTSWGARGLLKSITTESHIQVDVDPAAGVKTLGAPDPTIKRDFMRCLPPLFCLMVVLWVIPRSPWAGHMSQILTPGLNLNTVLMLLFASPIMFVMGARFHIAAFKAVKSGVLDMNVLISVSTGMTFGYSVLVAMFSIVAPYVMGFPHSATPPGAYFEAPCMIVTFLLCGKTLEAHAKQLTTDSLNELLGSQPLTANLLQSGTKATPIPVELVQIDDRIQVFPGDAVPVDGVMVSDGEAAFDESLLTGESKMIHKKKGDFIIGGSRCLSGRVELEVQRVGSGTMLSQISSLVEHAQTSRAPVQTVADTIAKYFIPCVISLAFVVWFTWYVIVFVLEAIPLSEIKADAPWPVLEKCLYVMEYGLTVLLVACPCALGLATPTAVMTATGVAAKFGILLKNGGLPLELGSKITHIVLDKTGTITEGKPKVHRAAAFKPQDAEVSQAWDKLREAHLQSMKGQAPLAPQESSGVKMEWLRGDASTKAEWASSFWWAVGCAEISSEHPLARVLVDVARAEAGTELVAPSNFENLKGKGVRCSVAGLAVQVGSVKMIVEGAQGQSQAALEEWARQGRLDGSTVIAVAIDGAPLGAVALRDQVKPYAKECIAQLQMSGMEVWMCTGDHAATAQAIAKEVGIQGWKIVPEALPADKTATIEKLQNEGGEKKNIVCMVGDGINDSPALAAADIGVAIGAGHNVTVDAADVVLVRSDFRDFVAYIQLAQESIRTIWRNFFWAFLFNMTAIPIAAGCFIKIGIKMSPYLAVAAMAFSSLFVVHSSLSLRNFEPKHRSKDL